MRTNAPESTGKTAGGKTPFKILIVEDEGLIAEDIAGRVKTLGHAVSGIADTGAEAVDMSADADLVLMDIRLDGPMDGVEAAGQIRQNHGPPVIFLTAHTDRHTLERAKTTGPYGYLVKPLSSASLQTAIEMAVYKHRMERQLEEREAWLSSVLSAISDGVIATDTNGQVQILNPAAEALCAWRQEEALQKSIGTVLRFSDAESGEEVSDPTPLAVVTDATVTLGRHALMTDKNGKRIPVEGEASPVRAAGRSIGAVLTLRDVSARRWEEQQLRQTQKLEIATRLAAGVATEFENLLATIHSQCDQLLEQFSTTRTLRGPLEEIKQATLAAEQINRRLAGFQSSPAHHREALSINGVIRRTARLVESIAGDRINTKIHLDQESCKTVADPVQLEQMVLSVAVHCCESMPDGGRLQIRTSRRSAPPDRDFVQVAFTCVANPLPAQGSEETTSTRINFERLFEPAAFLEEQGSLAVAFKIAADHDGFLEAEPDPSGQIEIRILLPRWTEPITTSELEERDQPATLLVDPREIVRGQIHNFFEANGYNLLEASDATEAIALAEIHEGSIDLLIAPSSDVEQIATALALKHPSLSVLRVVGQAEKESNSSVRAPYTQVELLRKVSAFFERRHERSAAAASS